MAHKVLTATFVLHKTRKDRLESVTELNAWGQDVEDISILSQSPHIRTVALACNCIKTLRQFSRCLKLEQLLLRKNLISDITEVQHLSRLQHLRILTLSENPIARDASYRIKVLALLPQLTRLDDTAVNPEEHLSGPTEKPYMIFGDCQSCYNLPAAGRVQVEEAQAMFPDALQNISLDGAAASQSSVPQDQDIEVWDRVSIIGGPAVQTPLQMSPAQSPAQTPPGGRALTISQRSSYSSGGAHAGLEPSPLPSSGAPRSKPGSYQPQYVEQPQPSPQQQTGFSGGFPAGAPSFNNGGAPSPQNQDLPQHLYAHQQQQLQPDQSRQMHRSTNGSLTSGAYQASPQHQQAGWQQDRQAEAEMGSAPNGGGGDQGGKGSADNIFYAIVALLPELGLKHLQWARDEVDARILELQQQQVSLEGRATL